ncbi:MAG TPA: hypothetical protein VHY84_20210 [Bryobacteraceae bacterium]|nr:hypothetical protein [Bryobacteraceae bacterium]
MDSSVAALTAYFQDYAASSAEPSAARTAAFYTDTFMVAGPRGSAAFKNDGNFAIWLRQLYEYNQQVGLLSMSVVSIQEPVLLSPLHILATVEWGARFQKTSDRLITFRITYLLENSNGQWKIISYISEKDQEEEMRNAGLL